MTTTSLNAAATGRGYTSTTSHCILLGSHCMPSVCTLTEARFYFAGAALAEALAAAALAVVLAAAVAPLAGVLGVALSLPVVLGGVGPP